MLTITIAIIIIIALLAIALQLLKLKGASDGGSAESDVYYLKKSLYSAAERSFLGILESIDFEDVTIQSKVRLADVFGLKKGLDRSLRQRALNRITSKHVDYLLVQKSDGRPLLGIELDDSSHEAEDRKQRDQFVDGVFRSAGLPLLHVPAKSSYDPKEIRRLLETAVVTEG